jgi:signal transduction histidine kinase
LGLAIARQLVEAQGGKITAATVAGGGLEVTFVL